MDFYGKNGIFGVKNAALAKYKAYLAGNCRKIMQNPA